MADSMIGNCKDCKYWGGEKDIDSWDVCRAIDELGASVSSNPLAWIVSGAWADTAVSAGRLETRADFGCVLFEQGEQPNG